ncbi:efflux RND transporter periplasmic adaptor subunit [Methylobacterium sp. J-078]|uniref:efflux RND transporter periplasmic adaptor subunit n=1 Tax=Methylobacterium sp. J-078 TaxID=2836657 RepID=UPI001FB9226F|nr:efflux RND transporter periplasmic adaptor subunit [Methylobacterium sp. J-078]MCJ2043889.1 efflux RND transporter periplasmic adaptor subunit [Methylobacterium sp. J-078]
MKRTIAAILAADVVGFSRLIAQDEEDTLRRLAEHAAIFRGYVADFRGRVFNTAGDAILAEFPSAVEALRAAIAIQETLRARDRDVPPDRRIAFRMGLNIGDVVVREDGDLLGDGVNIAARLEGLAEAGGICIARSVHEAVHNKVAVGFRDIGSQRLKNIPRPVHAYRVVWPAQASEAATWSGRLRRHAAPRWWWLPTAGIPILALGAWVAWDGGPFARKDAAGIAPIEAESGALAVAVAPPHRGCFKDEALIGGVVVPRREVDVRPDLDTYRVLSIATAPLASVSAGDVLARIVRVGAPESAALATRAPISGLVGRIGASPGETMSPASPPLFQIIAQGEYDLAAEVPLATLARLAPGQSAVLTPLGGSDLPGQVRTVAKPADPATQSGRVRVQIKEAGDLRQGTFARAVVRIDGRCGLAVPSAAVMIGPEGRFVYVADGDRIEARPVATGLTEGDTIEVKSGVKADDLVVLRAGPFLREGATITPVREAGYHRVP